MGPLPSIPTAILPCERSQAMLAILMILSHVPPSIGPRHLAQTIEPAIRKLPSV